jgi:hypothetical protein
MTTKEHLMAACCPPVECDQHAATIEALDPNVRATILALLRQFGAKALPIILAELPDILAGNYAAAIARIIAALLPTPAPAP